MTPTWPTRRSERAVISKHFDDEKEKGKELLTIEVMDFGRKEERFFVWKSMKRQGAQILLTISLSLFRKLLSRRLLSSPSPKALLPFPSSILAISSSSL